MLCDIMVNMFMMGYGLIWVDYRSGKIKDYKISISCLCTKNTELRSKSKDGLNVSEWNDIPYLWTVVTVVLHYKNPTKHVSLVQSGPLRQEVTCSPHELTNCSLCIKYTSPCGYWTQIFLVIRPDENLFILVVTRL